MSHAEQYLLIKIDDLIMAVEHDIETPHNTPRRIGRLHATLTHLNGARAALLANDYD